MTRLAISTALAAALSVAAIQPADARPRAYPQQCAAFDQNQMLNTVIGAAIGGAIGGQFGNDSDDRALGAIAGAIIGGFAGNRFGGGGAQTCDDVAYAQPVYYDAFENAPPRSRLQWSNPYTGNSGYVIPAREYRTRRGQECRDYQQIIYVDGYEQVANGTACRNRDGTWDIVR